jgi:hypothetical protein
LAASSELIGRRLLPADAAALELGEDGAVLAGQAGEFLRFGGEHGGGEQVAVSAEGADGVCAL